MCLAAIVSSNASFANAGSPGVLVEVLQERREGVLYEDGD